MFPGNLTDTCGMRWLVSAAEYTHNSPQGAEPEFLYGGGARKRRLASVLLPEVGSGPCTYIFQLNQAQYFKFVSVLNGVVTRSSESDQSLAVGSVRLIG